MEGDRIPLQPTLQLHHISIHSLRMEGDCSFAELVCKPSKFQSTPSAWRETQPSSLLRLGNLSFQSTPSAWRETDGLWVMESRQDTFQSTPSAWRETRQLCAYIIAAHNFNPLPPHGGRHFQAVTTRGGTKHFNPLPPHGGRLPFLSFLSVFLYISIHSLRMEGDSGAYGRSYGRRNISIHSLRMEGDTDKKKRRR